MLKHILKDQIAVAEKLSTIEGSYSSDASHAWDVVEELSRKLNKIETLIHEYDLEGVKRNKLDYDIELANRHYEL
jgi:hypothetical protein